jgi:hypothetical protein
VSEKKERTKHIQGNRRKKKEKFVTEPKNIIVFRKKAIYKINYEAV